MPMNENKLTIKLTDDQQKQIKEATGKSITELTIDFEAGNLTMNELDQAVGGVNTSRFNPYKSYTFLVY